VPQPEHGGKQVIARAWPDLAGRVVIIGGLKVTYAEAEDAVAALAISRTSAIAPVLAAAGNPLAWCDYKDAAAPHMAMARALPKTGRAGAAGRHVTKTAFCVTIAGVLEAARAAALGEALDAFAADERYAAEMAREAVAVRERAHVTGIRSRIRIAAENAIAACNAHSVTCALEVACGTGKCRFASPEFRAVTVPAGPGRLSRPVSHVRPGTGFSLTAATAQAVQLNPWKPAVYVSDSDSVTLADGEAA
jgi:hypothetical protein